jgi:hypothetical protein
MSLRIVRSMIILAALGSGFTAIGQAPTGLTSLPASAYEHVYRHVRHLKAVDDAAAATNSPSNLSSYYKSLANLTQAQAVAMQAVSLVALVELEALDQQAKTVILQAHAQARPLLPGQKPAPPPSQLASLQTARKALLAKYRDNLAQALGQAAFARLEQALIAEYKVGAQGTASTPHAINSGH